MRRASFRRYGQGASADAGGGTLALQSTFTQTAGSTILEGDLLSTDGTLARLNALATGDSPLARSFDLTVDTAESTEELAA